MLHKAYEINGKRLEIHTDDDPQNPRTECDNVGTMICFHRRYSLGDDKNKINELVDNSIETAQILITKMIKRGDIVLPLYLYDHSGITMKTTSFNDRWDSGQVGWIYVTKENARKEYNLTRITAKQRKKIESYLEGEVEVYDQYLTGDVYGFKIFENGEETNACWGFYGDDIKTNGIIDHVGEEWKTAPEAKRKVEYV